MNFTGILLAVFTFFAIGIGFVWVIKLEYHVGAHVARAVGILGVAMMLGSVLIPCFFGSALFGILGGTVLWGATELPDQEKRVAKGQFKRNPKKDISREGEGS